MARSPILARVGAVLFVTCCCASAALAQQQQPTPRSRDTRGNEERMAHMRCLSQTTTAYADYLGPQVARESGQAAYLMACVAGTMSAEWPSGPDYRAQADRLAAIARQADPRIDPCLLASCGPTHGK